MKILKDFLTGGSGLPEVRFKHYLTVDVEDWFHLLDLPGAPPMCEWHNMESRVEFNTYRLLDLLQKHDLKATFFVLGWIAERQKTLVRDIAAAGHEIASHGYSHILYHKSDPAEVRRDISLSKQVLEDITGAAVYGFRSPGFSIKKENLWVFEEISRAGYAYDSSVFPAVRNHGGNAGMPLKPFRFDHGLLEYPIGTCELMGIKIPFGGGGYFRLYPLTLIRALAGRYVKTQENPFVFYIHPREIDPDQPRLQMSPIRRFQTYVNLKSSYRKLDQLLSQVRFGGLLKEGAGSSGNRAPLPGGPGVRPL
jgi:polysaccharide deacetylase family protein (PEP-CTERM system associated)